MERVYGHDLPELGTTEISTGGVVVVKGMGPNGEQLVTIRHNDDLTTSDKIGMLTMALDVARNSAMSQWQPDEEEDE